MWGKVSDEKRARRYIEREARAPDGERKKRRFETQTKNKDLE